MCGIRADISCAVGNHCLMMTVWASSGGCPAHTLRGSNNKLATYIMTWDMGLAVSLHASRSGQVARVFFWKILEISQLSKYHHLAEEQSASKIWKQPGEAEIVADFSENYSFTVQDEEEIQSILWDAAQCTIPPFGVKTTRKVTQVPALFLMKHNKVPVWYGPPRNEW